MVYCAPESRRFDRARSSVEQTQRLLLLETLRRNEKTDFGKQYQFQSVKSVDDYRERTPISEWENVNAWVDRIAAGQQGVLTHQAVSVLEPTGGSSSAQKLIPYTADLQRQFQRAIRVWIYDLMSNRPALRRGRSYWSISPLAHRAQTTAGGVRIGFESDSAYLSSAERRLLQHSLAVPPAVAYCQSVEAAQFATMFHLLSAPDLALISVWSPTFLILLLEFLQRHSERLCESIESGEFRIPSEWGGVPDPLQCAAPRSVRRADEIRTCLRECSRTSDIVQSLWPDLGLISCWADGPSTYFANELKELVGPIEVQSKGLLATEAFVTVPLLSEPAPALAIRSHFFEFLPTGRPEAQATVLAHQLVDDEQYEVIVTTAGGLYRYRLHDEVQVVGHRGDLPLLRFVGRSDHTVDLVGEKLNAAHVQHVFDRTFAELAMRPTFAELVPTMTPHRGYAVWVAEPSLLEVPDRKHAFVRALEDGLCENPGYAYARSMNQLRPLQLKVLSPQEAKHQARDSLRLRLAAGVRLGDLKPRTLAPCDLPCPSD